MAKVDIDEHTDLAIEYGVRLLLLTKTIQNIFGNKTEKLQLNEN